MADILSQAEIEALLASLSSDGDDSLSMASAATPGVPVQGGKPPAPPPKRDNAMPGYNPGPGKRDARPMIAYEIYDFRRPDKFAKDQLRTMQMLHETFARMFASSLSSYLRIPVHVDLVSVEQIPYDEYLRSLTNSIINVFSMAPLAGQALIEVEFNVILSMIDRLLGGPGSMMKSSSALTDIEKALTESIINRALKDFHTAWEGIAQFTTKREYMETQSQFVQIVPPNDVIVSILFEIKVGEMRGAMSLCIPYLLLKPITPKLSAQRWFASNTKNTGKNAATLAKRLERTFVTCSARLGNASISVEKLLELQAGDVVVLNRQQFEEVDVLIDGQIKFRGRPGIRGKKIAVHVNRIATDTDSDGIAIRNSHL